MTDVKSENEQRKKHHETIEANKPTQLEKLRKKWKHQALLLAVGNRGPMFSLGKYNADLESVDVSLNSHFFDLRWIGVLSINPIDAKELVERADNRKLDKNIVACIQINKNDLIEAQLFDINKSNPFKIRFHELPSIDPVKMENRLWAAAEKENTINAFETYYSVYPDGLHTEEAHLNIAKIKGTVEAYKTYLRKYPYAIYSSKIEDDFWAAVKKENTAGAFKLYYSFFPEGRHINELKKIYTATITSPNPKDQNLPSICGTVVHFKWQASSGTDAQYWVYVGSTQGGYEFFSESMQNSITSVKVSVPYNVDGNTVYVTLWTRQGSKWEFESYQYTCSQ